jgi:LL-diaminopimelate aminotransferase
MKIAKRMEGLEMSPFSNMKAKAYGDAIDFSLGSPDVAPEQSILDVIQAHAANPKEYRYAVNPLPELLEEIRKWYKRRYDVDLTEDEIVLLQGSQEALVNLPLVFCDPKEGVLIPDPYYPAYEQAPRLAQADVFFMPLRPEKGWLPDLNAIDKEIAAKTKLMIVSYPNNPTGAAAPDSFYEELIDFAKENDILVIHDNAYSELVFDCKPGKSFLSFPGAKEVGVELNSFSKTYGMAGARLGVLVGNEEAVQAYRRLKSNLDYGVFLPIQQGGIEALKHGGASIEQTRKTYEHRRDVMVEAFGQAGWRIPKSAGTMFLWAPVPEGESDTSFSKKLYEQAHIIVTPGSVYGPSGKDHVRIALVQDEAAILEAAKRLKQTQWFS